MATLRQLKIFSTVAEYKKMNLAADKLFIAQPTVSQTIIDLEKEYDTILFERHNKELKITPSGLFLLDRAKEIIGLYDGLDQEMKNLGTKRPLKIGATLTIGNTILSQIISQLNTLHPDIDATVVIDNTHLIEHRLLRNELDVALVEGIIKRKEIQMDPVFPDHLKLICGPDHPLADRTSLQMEDLAHQDFIMREQGSGTRDIFETIMRTNHIPYVTKWESCSSSAIIDAVRHNLGLGLLSSRCIKAYTESDEIVILPVESLNITRYFYLCFHVGHPITSQMKDFSDLIHKLSSVLDETYHKCI